MAKIQTNKNWNRYIQDPWIAVDLDGTLAEYHDESLEEIGQPIEIMVDRVKKWVNDGIKVKIFTARISLYPEQSIPVIEKWLKEQGIGGLEITNIKDHNMVELWDDRAVQVEFNTGVRADGNE